jgi:hypothetical protein
MAKEPKTPEANKETLAPNEPVKVEKAPEKPQAVIKVVAIAIDEEYTEPKGWVLKEIHSVDVESGKFFGVLVKVLGYPTDGVRSSKPVNLKN